jgi:hypothetical protein
MECEAILGRREISCALEHRITRTSGVLGATVNFRTGRVLVRFDETITSRAELGEKIEILLNDSATCGGCLDAAPAGVAKPAVAASKPFGRNLLLDLVVNAILPRPFDLLVPAISALRR